MDAKTCTTPNSEDDIINIDSSDSECDNDDFKLDTGEEKNSTLESLETKGDADSENEHDNFTSSKLNPENEFISENEKTETEIIHKTQNNIVSENENYELTSDEMNININTNEQDHDIFTELGLDQEYKSNDNNTKIEFSVPQFNIHDMIFSYYTEVTKRLKIKYFQELGLENGGSNAKTENGNSNGVNSGMVRNRAPYVCAVCSKEFRIKRYYKSHMLTHSNVKPHKCENCNKSFKRPKDLKRHAIIHLDEKEFACGECGKGFRHQGFLKKHLESHVQGITYKCNICDKIFKRSAGLKFHMLTHPKEEQQNGEIVMTMEEPIPNAMVNGEERLYKCPQCDKTFTKPRGVQQHMISHSEDKFYKCTYCEKAFKRSGDLNKHLKSHFATKSYNCKMCGLRFNTLSYLKQHSKLHAL